MHYVLALLLPWVVFLILNRTVPAILCFILQFTLIGWIGAAIWAWIAVGRAKKNAILSDAKPDDTKPVD
ncbi:MAG: YqaE/Pmp3 family membrane protein [Sneathiellales bacterium]|nr:YqaE/Pmp3 family membrane protein [Sneathiellales bacterium]